jgi:hypothetical protein
MIGGDGARAQRVSPSHTAAAAESGQAAGAPLYADRASD